MLALLLVAASSGAERVLRSVALGLAAVAWAAPVIYVAAQDVQPAVSDTITCGRVSSPQICSTRREQESCADALRKQKAFVTVVAVVPVALAAASVVVLARPRRTDEQLPASRTLRHPARAGALEPTGGGGATLRAPVPAR